MGGVSIAYAEIDGAPVCILDDGEWCERELGHEGAHVVAPMTPRAAGDAAEVEGGTDV